MTPLPTPLFDSGYRCETGPVRDRNEDSCLTLTAEFGGHFDLPPLGLYVVADGMGGQDEGHVASNVAARAFAEFVLSSVYFPLLRRQPPPREADVLDVLERAVFAAHDAVLPGNGNGGTTLTAALIFGRRLYVAHVGDSRAYLTVEGELRLLTEDHSLVRRLQDTGQLTAEDARTYQYRNVLLQALGQESALSADTFALDLPPEGQLLLCSDGLCGVVPREQLAATLAAPGTAQQAADRLLEAALAAGSEDNITAVVVVFKIE
jgi:protein phosphatase